MTVGDICRSYGNFLRHSIDVGWTREVFYTGLTSPTGSGSRLCVQVYKCQHSMAARYLVELCRPVSSIAGHQHLRSADRGQLYVPRVRLSTYGRRAFSHAGPSAWNSIPDHLKDNTLSLSTFRRQLKHVYTSRSTSTLSAFGVIL